MAQYSARPLYTRARIEQFIASEKDTIAAYPLTTPQLHSDKILAPIKDRTLGPIDLLYSYAQGEHKPAIGFQQMDGESDEEEEYMLAYVDPELENDWRIVRP